MELVKENVLDVLAVVMEPDLKKDIVSANLVEDLKIENNSVSLKVLVSNPALHARRRMQEAVEFNLKNKFGKNLEIVCEVAAMPARGH